MSPDTINNKIENLEKDKLKIYQLEKKLGIK